METIYFDEVSSTNDVAVKGNYPHGTCIVAQQQTAGRGQRGNKWESRPGENLTFSLVLRPVHIPVVEQYRISMMAALAASDAIRAAGVNCMIKWSNDLYVGDKKIGGILIEHSLMGEMLTESVVGVGINVNQKTFPRDIPNPTSLILESGSDFEPIRLLELFAERFEIRYAQSVMELHRDYMARLWRGDGVLYRFSDSSGEFMASIESVEPLTGRVTLRTETAQMRSYWFKEVEFLI